MMMLNPQPLPPFVDSAAVVARATLVTGLVPRGCPGCTSGVFQVWQNTVDPPLVVQYTLTAAE